jgi:protein-disulfide isomerase
MHVLRRLNAAAIAGATLLILTSLSAGQDTLPATVYSNQSSPGSLRGPERHKIMLADDWVRVPSTHRNSSSNSGDVEVLAPEAAQTGGGHPQRGSDGAPVTITEYSDFQCPYCRVVEGTLRQVFEKYGDQVRLVYMDFPLSFHQHAMDAAIAARCADDQGKFWQYHDALMGGQRGLSIPELEEAASDLGLESRSFGSCLEQRKYESVVLADKAQGDQIGASGTPYFLVNRQPINGAPSLSDFEKAIDAELQRGGSR